MTDSPYTPDEFLDQAPPFEPVPLQRLRHDGWTVEKQRMFLAALAATGAVGTAARLVGMTRKAAYDLRRKPGAESFAEAWETAIDTGRARAFDVLMHRESESSTKMAINASKSSSALESIMGQRWRVLSSAFLLATSAGAEARPHSIPLAQGDHYVAMGSSFAAGPGVTKSADSPPNRCNRSADNYPRQVAARLGLSLTDVSCGGATTGHILGEWNELPPQIDALRADTKLVTITIGGNDVGYIAGLFAASCAARAETAMCKGFAARRSGPLPIIDETTWQSLDARFDQIAAEVRKRAPMARLVFVDYLTILPSEVACDAVPLERAELNANRKKAARLATQTAQAARRAGARIIRASRLSKQHDACAKSAWMNGFPDASSPPTFVGYHPNLAGMTAVADSVVKSVQRGRK